MSIKLKIYLSLLNPLQGYFKKLCNMLTLGPVGILGKLTNLSGLHFLVSKMSFDYELNTIMY